MLEIKDKQVVERYEALKAMNFLVKSLNDESAYYNIWCYVIPDEADNDELLDIAENDMDSFADACKTFRAIMKKYSDDGFYFGGDNVY